MNSEMLSFILFLLYSDDLRQQSDRVILELSKENDNRTKAVTDAIAEILKNENNLFSIKSQEYFSGQYNRIIDQIKNSSDPERVTAELIPLLQIEDTLLYKKTISYLDKQYAILINELKNHNSKKIASEIIASLKDDETEFFDRAANHVFMYYTELKDEIKANSNVQNFSQEVSRLLKGNNESLIKLLKDFGDKHEVIKKDNHTMEFIKDSITELTKKISHLSKRNSKCRKKSV